jgi:ribosomal protein L35AE/L33A
MAKKTYKVFEVGKQVATTSVPSNVDGRFLLKITDLPSPAPSSFYITFVDLGKKSDGKIYKGFVQLKPGTAGSMEAVITPTPHLTHSGVGNILIMEDPKPNQYITILWIVIAVIIIMHLE